MHKPLLMDESTKSSVQSNEMAVDGPSQRSTHEMMNFLKKQLDTQSLETKSMAKSLRCMKRKMVAIKKENRIIRKEKTRFTEQKKFPAARNNQSKELSFAVEINVIIENLSMVSILKRK